MDRFVLGVLFWVGIPALFLAGGVEPLIDGISSLVFGLLALFLIWVALPVGVIWGAVFLVKLWLDKRSHAKYLEQDRKRTERNNRQQEQEQEQEQERKADQKIWEEHFQKKQKEEQARQERERKKPNTSNPFKITSRADALAILDLKEPFTPAELKSRWRDLLKQTHPDQGGSNMVLRLVNEAYDYLKGGAG